MEESLDPSTEAIQETGRPAVERQVQNLDADCQMFLKMLLKRVGKKHGGRKPLNIALVGPPGVGKSSFLCSLFAALSQDTWRAVAVCGSHGAEARPITVRVVEIKKCGLELDPEYAEKYKDYLLPTLIDLAGVGNEHNDLCKELFKIVFFGRLPKGQALLEAKQYGEMYGVKKLREKYTKNYEVLKVDRIIFFASATEEVPTGLIQSVLDAARPGAAEYNQREIPVFGFMTKFDRVKAGEVTQAEFENRERKFIESLGLKGSTTAFMTHKNYCDETDPDKKRLTSVIREIDAPLLLFMTQVCDSVIQVINPEETLESEDRRREENEAEQNPQNKLKKDVIYSLLLIFLSCIVIYVVFCWLVSLSSKPESQPPTHREL